MMESNACSTCSCVAARVLTPPPPTPPPPLECDARDMAAAATTFLSASIADSNSFSASFSPDLDWRWPILGERRAEAEAATSGATRQGWQSGADSS